MGNKETEKTDTQQYQNNILTEFPSSTILPLIISDRNTIFRLSFNKLKGPNQLSFEIFIGGGDLQYPQLFGLAAAAASWTSIFKYKIIGRAKGLKDSLFLLVYFYNSINHT